MLNIVIIIIIYTTSPTMAKRVFRFDNPKDVEEMQRMFLESEDEEEKIEFDNESDLDENDHVEMRSENSDSEQSVLSQDDEEDENQDKNHYYLGKDKTSKWMKRPIYNSQIRRQPQNILSELPQVRAKAKGAKTEFDAWNCFVSENILDIILLHTNNQINSVQNRYSRDRDAKQTDKIELKAFLGLLYLAGFHRNNRLNLMDLWNTDGTGIELFRLTMSLRRFRFLHNCIRFDDKSTRPERLKVDKLAAVRDIFSLFVDNCKSCYTLGQNVTIDEMLAGFRGRCGFRQYIPSKPNRYGIKIFAMVDSKFFTQEILKYMRVSSQRASTLLATSQQT